MYVNKLSAQKVGLFNLTISLFGVMELFLLQYRAKDF